MEAMIHVGNDVDMKMGAEPLADAIAKILAAIGEHRIDRETGIAALKVLTDVSAIGGITFEGCNLQNYPEPAPPVSVKRKKRK